MTTKIKPKSEILAAVHKTATDFYKLGFITNCKMCEFDALYLEPFPIITATARQAGLHRGTIWVSDDFDEPLPETF
jgi:hypothetical protein